MEVVMHAATINGATLEYELAGTGEPALFIYGAFVADLFRPVIDHPHLAGYRRIHYHRAGYAGSSQAAGPVTVSRVAAGAEAILEHLGVARAHVVGHSYGGAVALQLAIDAPERIHTLSLLEPALMAGASAPAYRESLTKSAQRFREEDPTEVVDAFLEARLPGYRTALDRLLPGAFQQALADAGTWFACELPGLLEWRFGETGARRIAAPALCMLGGESEALWPRFGEAHRLLLDWLPQAEAVILPGVTHFPQLQDPAGVAAALAAFWARHPMSSAGEPASSI
jgi:pimeloyl-ACP methyl ester carboxylesterase